MYPLKYGAGDPVHVSVRRQADRAEFVVRDRGVGIAEADQIRIFERFERAVSIRNFGGLGLGLYIVRWIVAVYGGSVHAESKPGAGAAACGGLDPRCARCLHRSVGDGGRALRWGLALGAGGRATRGRLP